MPRFPLILSSPSGGGKTTIAKELLHRRSDMAYSVSCTTRSPRHGEEEGRDYYFLADSEFAAARSNGEFAESAEVHGKFYGTLKREVERILASGRHVVMDIDVQGARQFAEAYPDSVLVFIVPPDAETLLSRLRGRGTENDESMARRIRSAVEELRALDLYGYLVVNRDLGEAVQAVSSIVDSESMRLSRIDSVPSHIRAMISDLESELENMNRRG